MTVSQLINLIPFMPIFFLLKAHANTQFAKYDNNITTCNVLHFFKVLILYIHVIGFLLRKARGNKHEKICL